MHLVLVLETEESRRPCRKRRRAEVRPQSNGWAALGSRRPHTGSGYHKTIALRSYIGTACQLLQWLD